MNVRSKDINKLEKSGVYVIHNLRANKVYIGSTNNFNSRLSTHEIRLKANNHENSYLQRAYNKDSKFFEFRLLLICDDYINWEQRAFDIYKPFDKRGYNICKIAGAPPRILSEETLKKRSETFKVTINEAMKYYKLLKLNKITENDIPDKYRKLALSYIDKKIWNKGKTYKSTEHLKVPKKKKGSRKKFIETMLSKNEDILVYDKNNNFINSWKTISELIEYSKSKDNMLPINSRFKKDRMNVNNSELLYPGIKKALRTNTLYKGLFFKYKEPS